MTTRLTVQDASFFFLEGGATPMHIGSLAVFRTPRAGFSYDDLLNLVESRLPLVPRYRQKVRQVALGLTRPVWIDDTDFDITYHIRRSALPKPGSDEQLHDLIARLMSRPLDQSRPLWEIYLVEGLARNRFAIFAKSHSSLVDGEKALEITHVIFDARRTRPVPTDEVWVPAREPGDAELVFEAVAEMVSRPGEAVTRAREAVDGVASGVASGIGEAGRVVGRLAAVVRTAAQVAPVSPLNAVVSRHRRYAVAATNLDDYRLIKARRGGTINDVILAVVAGALRSWLLSRGEPITASTTVRALVPMSVYVAGETAPGAIRDTSGVSSILVDLPVGEPNPMLRLSHIAHSTAVTTGQSPVTAATLVALSGFASNTLHAMGARVASGFTQRVFNVLVTNAPGPQSPLYVGQARMVEMYPVPPLLRNQALAIGLTSYDGHVFYGLNADREAMADVEVLPGMLIESLEELAEVAGITGDRR